jgi:hypothetical protein
MAAALNTCTKVEQRDVRFLWAKNVDATKDLHKEMLPIFLCGYPLLPYFCPQNILTEHLPASSLTI